MDIRESLSEIGLSEGEIGVYIALLKLGSAPASKIKEATGLHRTTIYDFVEKLLNKGLINHSTERGTRYFRATPPEKLLDYVQERQSIVEGILPKLKALSEKKPEEIAVAVYRGLEGLKTLLNDLLRVGKDYVAFGVEEYEWETRIPEFVQQHFRREKEIGIIGRGLASEGTQFTYEPHAQYRYIPAEYFNPTSIAVYGDRTATIIWEPLTVVIVTNKHVADSHRKHFELLWKNAKKKR